MLLNETGDNANNTEISVTSVKLAVTRTNMTSVKYRGAIVPKLMAPNKLDVKRYGVIRAHKNNLAPN